GPLRLPFNPLVPVDPDLGRIREVRAYLDERRAEPGVPQGVGRPSARCLRVQVLFPRPEPDVPAFRDLGSPVTIPWVSRLAAVRGWCRGKAGRPRGSFGAALP